MRDADAPHRIIDVVGEIRRPSPRPAWPPARRKRGTAVICTTPPHVAQRVELRVVEVARMVAQRADAGMRRHAPACASSAAACSIASRETCATSTSMPSRFISAIAGAAERADRPPCSVSASPRSVRGIGGIGQRVVAVMGERHVARAERAKRREAARGRGRMAWPFSTAGTIGEQRRRAAPPRSRRRCGRRARRCRSAAPMAADRLQHRRRRGRRRPSSASARAAGPAARRRRSSPAPRPPRRIFGRSTRRLPFRVNGSGPSGQGMSIWVSRVSRSRGCSAEASVMLADRAAGGGRRSCRTVSPTPRGRQARAVGRARIGTG